MPYASSLASGTDIATPELGGNSSVDSTHSTDTLPADELLDTTTVPHDYPGTSYENSSSDGDSSSQASGRPSNRARERIG
jgi:hypothetical protein